MSTHTRIRRRDRVEFDRRPPRLKTRLAATRGWRARASPHSAPRSRVMGPKRSDEGAPTRARKKHRGAVAVSGRRQSRRAGVDDGDGKAKKSAGGDETDDETDAKSGSTARDVDEERTRAGGYHVFTLFAPERWEDDAKSGEPGARAWTRAAGETDDARRAPREEVEALLENGFHGGDVREILAECRDENDRKYDEETIEDMVRGLEESGRTVNAPFCFTRGATTLKRQLHHRAWRALKGRKEWMSAGDDAAGTSMGYGECEIGVYVSRAGGDIAEWHRDVGDNATIQLTGRKLWEVEHSWCVARCGARENFEKKGALNNASLVDEPICGADHVVRRSLARADAGGYRFETRRVTLEPGDTICVPRGRWHRVKPLDDEMTLSVDIRVTTVERGAWKAEEVYLDSLRCQTTPKQPLRLEPIAWLPFERCDGLVLSAHLDYMVKAHRGCLDSDDDDEDDVYAHQPRRGVDYGALSSRRYVRGLYFNPVCTCSWSRSGSYYILNIKASSALTKRDFMSEFNVYIARERVEASPRLRDRYRDPLAFYAGEVADSASDFGAVTHDENEEWNYDLRNVLLDANILLPDETHNVKSFWECALHLSGEQAAEACGGHHHRNPIAVLPVRDNLLFPHSHLISQ